MLSRRYQPRQRTLGIHQGKGQHPLQRALRTLVFPLLPIDAGKHRRCQRRPVGYQRFQKRNGLGSATQPLQHHGLSFHRALHYRAQRWRRLARPSDLRTRTLKGALHNQPAFFRSTGQRSYAPKTTGRQLGIIRRVALHGTVGTARLCGTCPYSAMPT